MDIVKRIDELMAVRGWSKYRLAKATDISQATISNIFKRNNSPTLPTLQILCDAFGITLVEFFSVEGHQAELTLEQQRLLTVWAAMSEQQRTSLLILLETCILDRA